MEQLRRIIKENEDSRISKRALLEKEISEFRKRLEKCDPEIMEQIGIVLDDLDCKKIFPSLYNDPFSIDDYNEEKGEYIKVLEKIDAFRNKLIAEAKEFLGIA
jgi:hypothetical protein